MGNEDDVIETVRAALLPHGLFLRGVVHFEHDGPALADGGMAGTIVLVGNVGGSLWPAFDTWLRARGGDADPLDTWSVEVIRPLADAIGATAYFPSEKPWQPFQQWAMRAEGLRASPLGILIHPEYGLWHGYRGAIGFAEHIGQPTMPRRTHPCDTCLDRPCLTACPVDAVRADLFDVKGCRAHIHSDDGQYGCMASGCLARNACPVGADFRYPAQQLQFHMAALA